MLIKSPARKMGGLAVVTMAALFALQLCESKPVSIGQTSLADEADPMLALPSGHRQQVIYVEHPPPPPQPQEVHYVYANAAASSASAGQPTTTTSVEVSPEPATQEVSLPHYQPEQAGYQIQYVSRQPQQPLEAPYQVIQVQAEPQQHQQPAQSHEGLDCNQRHEYAPVVGEPTASLGPSRGEYPGEILYIGQNSELLGRVGGSDGARRGLSSELAQSSGLPATILTEIPIKDMPLDVLEKLKKEYGVKVVATRERPGANLVINCDDYANQENSIYQRQQAQHLFADQPTHEGPVYAQAGPNHVYTLDEHHHHHHHQPQHQHQYQIRYRSPQRHQSRARINHDDVNEHHHHPNHHQDDLSVLLEAPARGQAYPSAAAAAAAAAANYSVEVLEHHSRPVEYVSAEPELTSTTSAANAEANGNDHAYGSRTTVSADELPEYVARTPSQSADDGPHTTTTSTTTTTITGHTEAAHSHSDTTSPAAGVPTEAAIGSPEDESRHEGFEEQPKSNAEEQDNSKSPAIYTDRH